ncbi:hypothetical protein B0A52_00590 [Exophiala mesophila]|uniref:Ribosomal RNA-processing protein 14/surfeit locus protein 6 C-terminal domain-containing protein n=1 Tax=Exophiala mesophila TaxID=212818 RepID=A0A438NHN3_EXOME|nr:hypothetical protein B0A52_00590 [Exophiala mesophila]
MADELEERLKNHARSFDSLLSLIPAKLYYGEDVSDQWQRKKQTPEQRKAAKLAKLDPDNWKSAKDVMDERAAADLKRKRQDEEDEQSLDSDDGAASETELPKAIQDAESQKSKRRKVGATERNQDLNSTQPKETEEQRIQRKKEQAAAKKLRRQEKKAKASAKLERQQARKKAQDQQSPDHQSEPSKQKPEINLTAPVDLQLPSEATSTGQHDAESVTSNSDAEPLAVFSPPHESGTSSSSTSSLLPPATEETKPSSSAITISNDDGQTPRERLQAAISQLRADRKADGPGARGPKSRQELLEQRRRKEEERKATKKEQKRREREEEARRQDEEIARRFSPGGSGSLLASPRSPVVDHISNNNFSFGRIAFDDGSQLDPSLSNFLSDHRKKGPTDTTAALKNAEAKKSKLAGLDEAKRKEIQEKDMWLNAKRKAHGEHVRDDTSLLKKALKRQQGQKKKSEKEWAERTEGIQKAQFARQKKRTENLAKRKDDKQAGKGKKLKRPGFEGSFKGRTGGKKKS